MSPSGIESSAAFTIIWWIVAITTVITAFLVIQLPDLLKAALALVASFMAVAGLYVMLGAEFLAVIQLLIYAGAIPILVIFAILVMEDVQRGNPFNRLRVPALFIASLMAGIVIFVAINTEWTLFASSPLPDGVSGQQIRDIFANTTPIIGGLLLKEFVLAMEAAGLLLLGSILGAIALVRER